MPIRVKGIRNIELSISFIILQSTNVKKRVPLNTYLYKLVSGAESGDQLMSNRIQFSTYILSKALDRLLGWI